MLIETYVAILAVYFRLSLRCLKFYWNPGQLKSCLLILKMN